jgi:hypothetical protein
MLLLVLLWRAIDFGEEEKERENGRESSLFRGVYLRLGKLGVVCIWLVCNFDIQV